MLKNLQIAGLICEFNPLHNGHKYLIDKIKEESPYLVCVMSGNFVQRGDVAIIDKYNRTKSAIEAGADLVIELPVWNALSTAEKFAFSGVSILNSMNIIDSIYFGSEIGDIEILKKCAELTKDEKVNTLIKEKMSRGDNFASIREEAIKEAYGESYGNIFKESNNILGIEYIKALNKLNSNIEAKTIKRHLAGHNEGIVENFASATKTRELIRNNESFKNLVPIFTSSSIEKGNLADVHNLERAILYKLRTTKPEDLLKVPDVSEGLENKIYTEALKSDNLESLYMNIKSKRYSLARIRRIILSAFLNITKDLPEEPQYIRVLGMNKKGEEILKAKTNLLPYILNYADAKKHGKENFYEFEAECDNIYSLAKNKSEKGNEYFTHPIIKL